MNERLDQVSAIFQDRLGTVAHIKIDEPLATDNPAGRFARKAEAGVLYPHTGSSGCRAFCGRDMAQV